MDDCGVVRASKLSKQDRRILKKLLKFKETLFRHEHLGCCDAPSRHIVVANGGLGNGVEREQLWCLFEKCGQIVDIVMKPSKPYAFVSFKTIDEAERAVNTLNGHRLEDDSRTDCPLLYLLYINEYDTSDMSSMYRDKGTLPSGLVVLKNFLLPSEENDLLSSLKWEQAKYESLRHRRAMHYGYKFMYESSDVDRNALSNKIPDSCNRLMRRLLDHGLITNMPDQLTVNQYQPGQGIPPHVDTHSAFEDTLVIVNLQSQITMEFKKCGSGESCSVVFPQLSVVIMSGEARYQWTHGITPRTMDIVPVATGNTSPRLTLFKRSTRTSLTFRTVRQSAVCHCSFPDQCDSQKNKRILDQCGSKVTVENIKPNDELSANQLESNYVHQVYETIATHFSDTRHSPWPRVASFINHLPDGAIVADIGCGNGKYLGINPQIFTVGCDRSTNLCDICHDRGYESFVCDGLQVAIREGSCDAVLCIAVIHHLSTTLRRQKALSEITRILRVGGQALVYVWALEQQRGNERSKYLKSSKQPNSSVLGEEKSTAANAGQVSPLLPVHINRTAFETQDIFVPWHLKKSSKKKQHNRMERLDNAECSTNEEMRRMDAKVFHRYYHTFVEGELEQLCKTIENVNIVDSYYDQGNWCIILTKHD